VPSQEAERVFLLHKGRQVVDAGSVLRDPSLIADDPEETRRRRVEAAPSWVRERVSLGETLLGGCLMPGVVPG
jgi:hypothetical protein